MDLSFFHYHNCINKKLTPITKRIVTQSNIIILDLGLNYVNVNIKVRQVEIASIIALLQTKEFETIVEFLHTSYEIGFTGTLYSLQRQDIHHLNSQYGLHLH